MLLIEEENLQDKAFHHEEVAKTGSIPKGITSSLIVSNVPCLQYNGENCVIRE